MGYCTAIATEHLLQQWPLQRISQQSKFAVIFCLNVCTFGQVSAFELKSDLQFVPRFMCKILFICCSFLGDAENNICRTFKKMVSHASSH